MKPAEETNRDDTRPVQHTALRQVWLATKLARVKRLAAIREATKTKRAYFYAEGPGP